MNLNIYTDGGSRGNPGPAAAGVVIESIDPQFIVHEAGYFIGRTTNNVAEYQGLIRGLEVAISLNAESVSIFSDSELLVRQITGQYKVKSPDLKPLYTKATQLLLKVDRWKIQHVYRESNSRADELANKAMDAKRDVIVASAKDFQSATGSKSPATLRLAGALDDADNAEESPVAKTAPAAPSTPRWTATLKRDPGAACPANCPANRAFHFGPSTPAGFCVYAAQSCLKNGPLEWTASHDKERNVDCTHCGVPIHVRLTP